MSVANEGDITVALDTRLNHELIQEGWARNRLENPKLRKECGFEVVDRIKVEYNAPQEVANAIMSKRTTSPTKSLRWISFQRMPLMVSSKSTSTKSRLDSD